MVKLIDAPTAPATKEFRAQNRSPSLMTTMTTSIVIAHKVTATMELHQINIHSNQNSLFFFQILGYFATISRTGTDPFSKYLDLATMICGITRFRFHSSRVSQIAKTTSYAARISNVENRVPQSALFATIWSSSDRFSKLLILAA